MSDNIEDLSKQYVENVWEYHARSVGLFPIPEYPEFEAERGMWSTALDVVLTTLRYIAPATVLTLFWGQQSFLFKLLKYIDSAVRSLIFSNEEQKQTVLQWLGEAGPVRVDRLDVVWRHGWIVCGVLDAALPGACAGHPPTKLSLKHAQAIADNYLGVEPVFTRQELESNDTLSRIQEWKLINYLENIRLSLSKLTPPTSKSSHASIQKPNAEEKKQFTLDYIARGSGLIAAQIKNKVFFKIYPTAQQSLDPGEINILIHGPKDTYGITVLPPILGKAQMIRQNLLGLQSKTSYTENILPITHGTTYLRSYGNNNIHKTFYIPKTKYDIDIDVDLKPDHARVGYIATMEGKYEISITSRGQNVVGSPFAVTASINIVGSLEKDSFCLEDGEEIDIVDVKTDRKVVLRIVDFVTEKMLLKENGTFEKISEEEAQHLMKTENVKRPKKNIKDHILNNKDKSRSRPNKFYLIAHKVLTLNRYCKIFRSVRENNLLLREKDKNNVGSRQKQDIPDILNSAIDDGQVKPHTKIENRNRVIIPENISVSLLTEKSKDCEFNRTAEASEMNTFTDIENFINFHQLKVDRFEDDTISVDTVQSINNPFAKDIYNQNCLIEKGLKSFIPNEYETHNSQNEETENITEKIFTDTSYHTSKQNINPFTDNIELERPKTPVYKIITGELSNRNDSVYVDPEQAFLEDENIHDNDTNPFFKYQTDMYQEKPDFIIGAPVSLPPVNFASSSTATNTNVDIITKTEKKKSINKDKEANDFHCKIEVSSKNRCIDTKDPTDDNFSSLDSNLTQDIIIIPRNSSTPTTVSGSQTSREMSPKKDTWDSAYVSIDDTNCLSENNINELINDTLNKRRSPLAEEFLNMGPAEREIWQYDSDLKGITHIDEDYKLYKCDLKRSEFTPIIEENERNLLSGMKDDTFVNKTDSDSVAETFAELNDLYYDHYTNFENNSVTNTLDNKLQNLGIDYTLERNDIHVDSASEILTDVKRQAKKFEGEISEVQLKATESFSVSQNLHVEDTKYYEEQNNNDKIQFGDRIYSNIVLEKKKYWDDKIRQIEAKSEEIRLLQNKKRLSSKHSRRNDSISKRKGKKLVQQLLKSGHGDSDIFTKSSTQSFEICKAQENCQVIKGTKIPDQTYESNKYNLITCFEKNVATNKNELFTESFKATKENTERLADIEDKNNLSNSTLQLKQELPEKVFQAFETSPKRFFGTSRNHILNKIDTVLGSPDEQTETKKYTSDMNHESGLVSSRISLFHNISQSQDLTFNRNKSKSLHNISHQNSEKRLSTDNINRYSKCVVEKDNTILNVSCPSTPNMNTPRKNYRIHPSGDQAISLKEKRARLTENINNISFDETSCLKHNDDENANEYVKQTIKSINKQSNSQFQHSTSKLKSFSKSEMDIFSKATDTRTNEDLDKHKSYEELPIVSVKNFILLYEDVSKTSNETSPKRNIKPTGSSKNHVPRSTKGTTSEVNTSATETPELRSSSSTTPLFENSYSSPKKKVLSEDDKTMSIQSLNSSLGLNIPFNEDKETKYLSLSDIEIEIIDNDKEKRESSPESETAHLEYKNRFTKAKQFFQSLEELREVRKITKNSQNGILGTNESIESPDSNKRRKKSNIKKSHSMPSSEIAKAWNQLQEQTEKEENKKLVKISEKFNVDDLFEDVMEGRLSRQGSLRGIPHKKAVLETFRSMENISDNKLNSYEMAESQLNEFDKENKVRNAQTYLTEYPYLPTTEPSNFQSRLDVNASGLITLKELKKIPRRNSVPDLRLNASFTADL